MSRWPRIVLVVIVFALGGCSTSLPSSPSKVPKSASAHQIADMIPGCTHLAKVWVSDGLEGGTDDELKKLNRSDSGVFCDFHGARVMIESNPAATFTQTAMPSSPSEYVLVGTTWTIDVSGIGFAAQVSLKKQLAVLTTIQSKLGGKILLDAQARSSPRTGVSSGQHET